MYLLLSKQLTEDGMDDGYNLLVITACPYIYKTFKALYKEDKSYSLPRCFLYGPPIRTILTISVKKK